MIAALAFGYLCGSIPFGLLLTKVFGTADLRSIGSGNIGATNVLRTGRKDLAAATLLLDALKGTAAVLIAARFGPAAAGAAGLGAFLGHLFPIWLQFKGGKGIATYIGVLLGLFWPAAAMFGAIWIASTATICDLEDAGQDAPAAEFRGALAVNLALNAAWSGLFFRAHHLPVATAGAAVLAASSADLARRAAKAGPGKAVSLGLYAAWCGFATVLSGTIARLNR